MQDVKLYDKRDIKAIFHSMQCKCTSDYAI